MAQIELYAQKMRENSRAIEVAWYDPGHISAALQTDLAIVYQEQKMRFVARLLGQPPP